MAVIRTEITNALEVRLRRDSGEIDEIFRPHLSRGQLKDDPEMFHKSSGHILRRTPSNPKTSPALKLTDPVLVANNVVCLFG